VPYIEKSVLLTGTDLREDDVDLPSVGPDAKARVRGLPAAYSNEAQSSALEMKALPNGDQVGRVNTHTMECLQVLHGCVDPRFDSITEVEQFAAQYGPAFRAIVDKIDDLSAIDKEAIDRANATFRAGGQTEGGPALGNGAAARDAGPDLDVRAGAGAGDVDR